MEVRITPTPEQEAFIREGIASGRFQDAADATRIALQRWEDYERKRAQLRAEIHLAETSLKRGGGVVLDTPENIGAFFGEVRRRNRSRLEAKR